jgi:hypothetical protein
MAGGPREHTRTYFLGRLARELELRGSKLPVFCSAFLISPLRLSVISLDLAILIDAE